MYASWSLLSATWNEFFLLLCVLVADFCLLELIVADRIGLLGGLNGGEIEILRLGGWNSAALSICVLAPIQFFHPRDHDIEP